MDRKIKTNRKRNYVVRTMKTGRKMKVERKTRRKRELDRKLKTNRKRNYVTRKMKTGRKMKMQRKRRR